MKRIYRVATRASTLAMAQTHMAVDALSVAFPEADFEIVEIKTTGDRRLEWSLEKAGGKGLFTKEIEDALLDGSVDLAVHSAKDLPAESPVGLKIAAVLPRDDSRDVLVLKKEPPSVIASGSPRRRSQLKKIFPQAVWKDIRGNIETRLKKLDGGYAEAGVVSAAALDRLKIESFGGLRFMRLKVQNCVPAAGQGIIALQCRQQDAEMFSKISDLKTMLALELEREFLSSLGGGCQSAYAAHFDGSILHVYHENCGYAALEMDTSLSMADLKGKVREITSGLGK